MVDRQRIEHQEQCKLVARVRAFLPDILIAAVPNGGSRTPQERVSLHAEGVLAGMPDLCVLEARKGFHGLFLEMKTAVGVASDAQNDIAVKLNSRGYLCLIARSADMGWKLINDYLEEKGDE